MHDMLQQIASNAMVGPAISLQGMQLQRPMDVVKTAALPADDKRTILAAWASDFYAVDSKPAFRHLPGTPPPVSIDEIQFALRDLTGVTIPDHRQFRLPVLSTWQAACCAAPAR